MRVAQAPVGSGGTYQLPLSDANAARGRQQAPSGVLIHACGGGFMAGAHNFIAFPIPATFGDHGEGAFIAIVLRLSRRGRTW